MSSLDHGPTVLVAKALREQFEFLFTLWADDFQEGGYHKAKHAEGRTTTEELIKSRRISDGSRSPLSVAISPDHVSRARVN